MKSDSYHKKLLYHCTYHLPKGAETLTNLLVPLDKGLTGAARNKPLQGKLLPLGVKAPRVEGHITGRTALHKILCWNQLFANSYPTVAYTGARKTIRILQALITSVSVV